MPQESPYTIVLSVEERTFLEKLSRKYTAPYNEVIRAKAILLAGEGMDNEKISEKLDIPRQIVSKWRKRFYEHRIEGLKDEKRSGRPSTFSP